MEIIAPQTNCSARFSQLQGDSISVFRVLISQKLLAWWYQFFSLSVIEVEKQKETEREKGTNTPWSCLWPDMISLCHSSSYLPSFQNYNLGHALVLKNVIELGDIHKSI